MIYMSSPASIRPYLTMHIGGTVNKIEHIQQKEDLIRLLESYGDTLFILGGGSNTLFSDIHHDLTIGKIDIPGINTVHENTDTITLEIGTGVSWDQLVAHAVRHGYQGIEALSAIPGSVGATPIQNVGAYGSEIRDVLVHVHVYDRDKKEFTDIQNKDCSFGYRDSLFKHIPGRFVVTSITLTLKKMNPTDQTPIPSYKGVTEKLSEKGIETPSLSDIRNTIIEIRKTKLPDPKLIPNSGSFFKNPRLSKEAGVRFIQQFPKAPYFIEPDGLYKIPAGWLLEQTGFKGFPGPVGTYEHNALVVINRGGNFHDLTTLVTKIQNAIKEKYNIMLEIEPNIIM